MMIAHRRWGDNDRYFGPLTFVFRDKYDHGFALVLSSTDDEDRGCTLRLSLFRMTVLLALPDWCLRPERKKVYPDSWDAETITRLGRNWYWGVKQREFGVSITDGFLNVRFGRQTHDSSTEQRWGYFLPWTQWRHVRHSLYGYSGTLFAHLPHAARWGTLEHEWGLQTEEKCPTFVFSFFDFDGERLSATTKIEEREWHFGTGWFKWLSWFRAPKIRRSLDIRFSGETGERKGSWKGGTIGHSIDMLRGELHEAAFRRYCEQNNMTFIKVGT